MSPERRRRAVTLLRHRFDISERWACRVASQPRAVQRYIATVRADEDALTQSDRDLCREYGRYGYRRVTTLLNERGWSVAKDRVQRIWRPKGSKSEEAATTLWLNDGSCVRLRAKRANYVWSYDFVHHATHDGRSVRPLTLVDEFTREAFAITVARKLNSMDVIETAGRRDAKPQHPGVHPFRQRS